MGSGRPPLPIGSWGKISSRVLKTDAKGKATQYLAKANFHDHDGHVRDVSATGRNKTAAEQALLVKLRDRAKVSQAGELTAMDKIGKLLDLWEEKFTKLVAAGTRSPTSYDTYQRVTRLHIRPAIAGLRIGEATTQRLDKVISKITENAGASTAKTARAIISGAMSLAVRYNAITVNPMREIEAIEAAPKNPPRALTAEEVTLLRKSLAADPRAVDADLPDLVAFMLGTGVRIGEALAVTWSQVDLEAGTVEITHTIARVRGQGLIRKTTKSTAGQRLLPLPHWLIAILRARQATGFRLDDPVFPDTTGNFRDPSNTRRHLRTALSPIGSTARRNLGLTLRALRRTTKQTRKDVATKIGWPQHRVELIETGRIKPTTDLVTELIAAYGLTLADSSDLVTQLEAATQPADSDRLSWIRSHALRKTTATALDAAGHTARQVADQLGQTKISITQDVYMGRKVANPAAAEALDDAFGDLDMG
ncbi:tyrosine-type recombinase/integrase [Kribbella sp. NPDC005582]|uniref:helix-turn-helix domain-containing protein n=1 Tax=Kribbella sp. NPDC005582 TaxID=3156893 RepID=UPI0033ABFBFC